MNKNPVKITYIAPCGMNCTLCMAFLRDKNTCPGCRTGWDKNRKYIRKCIIRNCRYLKKKKLKYCSIKCGHYPCQRLRNLDKRYRTRYSMSMTDNLENINKNGIKSFIKKEKKRWVKGNKIFCVHKKCYFDLRI